MMGAGTMLVSRRIGKRTTFLVKCCPALQRDFRWYHHTKSYFWPSGRIVHAEHFGHKAVREHFFGKILPLREFGWLDITV
jgi:hypothetical protein